jgi:steroid delta-isomerase-like uncharacterized protein
MTIEARVKRVEEHLAMENAHDLEGVMRTFGKTARYDDEPWQEHHVGHEAVRTYYREMLEAAPDLVIEKRAQHVTPEVVILEVNVRGTHRGPWRGLPPTGRPIEFPLCAIYTFDPDDALAGERIYYDRASVLTQLGVLHDPAGWTSRLLTPVAHPVTVARALLRLATRLPSRLTRAT